MAPCIQLAVKLGRDDMGAGATSVGWVTKARDQSHACLILLYLPRRDELIHGAHVGLVATGRQGVHQWSPEIVRGPENATKVTRIL